MLPTKLWTPFMALLAFIAAACGGSSASDTVPRATTPTDAPSAYTLGEFPEFPHGSLPRSAAAALQAALDATVENGTFTGVTAAAIVADRGSWSGAAGSLDGVPLTPASRLPTHSAGKTIVAAEVLRLVEHGKLGLDDPASDYLPAELSFFDANGATIRQVLAMRSGIPDLKEFTTEGGFYPAERASTAVKVFKKLPKPEVRPGSETRYASTNYVLLGTIIEHATGRALAEALRSDVLDRPGLEGLVYTVQDALAADGYGVESTAASLARWGYELYGGFVISGPSVREMTDFYQDPCCDMRYGLGVFDFSAYYGTPAVGHEGEGSAASCCSSILLVALPEEGVVVSVQANTAGTSTSDPFSYVQLLTQLVRDAAQR
jgi:CubicO group peptidase (beta-lactamase class C family)